MEIHVDGFDLSKWGLCSWVVARRGTSAPYAVATMNRPQQIAREIDIAAQRRFFRRSAFFWLLLIWRLPQLCFVAACVWWVVR